MTGWRLDVISQVGSVAGYVHKPTLEVILLELWSGYDDGTDAWKAPGGAREESAWGLGLAMCK